jgi:hypothetical protein
MEIAKAFAVQFPKNNVIEIVAVTSGQDSHQEMLWIESQQQQ